MRVAFPSAVVLSFLLAGPAWLAPCEAVAADSTPPVDTGTASRSAAPPVPPGGTKPAADPACDVARMPTPPSDADAALLSCRGRAWQALNRNDDALAAFRAAHARSIGQGNLAAAAEAALQIARIHQLRNQTDRSFEILTSTYERVREAGAEDAKQGLLDALAAAYYNNGRLDLAEAYYRELLHQDGGMGDRAAESVTRFNLAHVYASQGRFDDADREFSRSYELAEALRDQEGVAQTLKAWGENAHAQGDLALAQTRFEDALRRFVALGNAPQQGAVLRHLGDVAVKRGDGARAIEFYLAAIRTLQPLEFELPLLRSYRGVAQAYALEANYEKAYLAHQIYVNKLQQELRREQDQTVQRLQSEFAARFETQKLADRNKQLSLENARQQQQLAYDRLWRNGLMLVAGLALSISTLLWLLWRNGRKFGSEMARLATTDVLTGLYNRRSILDFAHAEWGRRAPTSVLLLDVDHFKSVNDTYGHAVGDEVLKGVARAVQTSLRITDRVGRYGGEEFLVVTPGTDCEQAAAVAERVRASVAALTFEAMPGRRVTVSIGVADKQRERTLEAAIQIADQALYDAKTGGRDRVRRARDLEDVVLASGMQPVA